MNSENENRQPSTPRTGNERLGKPSDERFADTKTDADPRTSDEGMTSIGGYDVNADALPSETPGVRHEGDEENVVAPSSVNTNLKGDIMHPGA